MKESSSFFRSKVATSGCFSGWLWSGAVVGGAQETTVGITKLKKNLAMIFANSATMDCEKIAPSFFQKPGPAFGLSWGGMRFVGGRRPDFFCFLRLPAKKRGHGGCRLINTGERPGRWVRLSIRTSNKQQLEGHFQKVYHGIFHSDEKNSEKEIFAE